MAELPDVLHDVDQLAMVTADGTVGPERDDRIVVGAPLDEAALVGLAEDEDHRVIRIGPGVVVRRMAADPGLPCEQGILGIECPGDPPGDGEELLVVLLHMSLLPLFHLGRR